MAFKMEPEKGLDQVDEKVLYRGWLPVEDEPVDPAEDAPRLALEAFIRSLVRDH